MAESEIKKKGSKIAYFISFLIGLILPFIIPIWLIFFYIPTFEVKYGGWPTPFDNKLLQRYKISGKVKSQSTNLPLGGVKVKIKGKNIETKTNNKGIFEFELFNMESNIITVLVENTASVLLAEKSVDINFNNKINAPKIRNFIRLEEATVEIVL